MDPLVDVQWLIRRALLRTHAQRQRSLCFATEEVETSVCERAASEVIETERGKVEGRKKEKRTEAKNCMPESPSKSDTEHLV